MQYAIDILFNFSTRKELKEKMQRFVNKIDNLHDNNILSPGEYEYDIIQYDHPGVDELCMADLFKEEMTPFLQNADMDKLK